MKGTSAELKCHWYVALGAVCCACWVASGLLGFLGGGPVSKWFGLGIAVDGVVMAVAFTYIVRQRRSRHVSLLDQAGTAEVSELLARGEFWQAVRRVRELTNLPLVDARRLADSLRH